MLSINLDGKKILDVTCGDRSIWFNKHHPAAVYTDRRDVEHIREFEDSTRRIIVHPDIVADFTSLPFDDGSFSLVVFDPPPFAESWRNWLACEDVWQTGRKLAADVA